MRMTQKQAIDYCTRQRDRAISTKSQSSPIPAHWNMLADLLASEGLDEAEAAVRQDKVIVENEVKDSFLAAINDEKEIKCSIAQELLEQVNQKIDEGSERFPEYILFLNFLADKLEDAVDESLDLDEVVKDAAWELTTRIDEYKKECQIWLEQAIAAQGE